MQKNTVQFSRLIISLVFVLSSITKLISLEFFDGLVAELFLGDDWALAGNGLLYTQIFSRLMIAGELVLGVAILQSKYVKSIVIPAIEIMLLIFTAHLFYVGFTSPEGFIEGNCGCFGDIIPMNNLESILKNVITMALGAWVYLKFDESKMEFSAWIPPVFVGWVSFGTLLLTVQVYQAVDLPEVKVPEVLSEPVVQVPEVKIDSSDENEVETEEEALDASAIANMRKVSPPKKENERSVTLIEKEETVRSVDGQKGMLSPAFRSYTEFSGDEVDLFKGEKILCLFSLSCGHCQSTYKDLVDIKKKVKIPPMYLINYGKKFDEGYFFSQAGEINPHTRMENYFAFDALLEGSDFPKVIHLKDGKIIESWDLETIGDDSKQVFNPYFGVPKETPVKEKTGSDNWGGSSAPWDNSTPDFLK